MPARSEYTGYVALEAVLKGINGETGGYWHDVKERVYRSLPVPEDKVAGMPYLCLPRIDEGPVEVETYDYGPGQAGIRVVTAQELYGFAPETGTGLDSTSVEAVHHLWEDCLRALMADWTLGGAVEDVTVVPGGHTLCKVEAGDPYGEFLRYLHITTRYDRSQLGPSA